MLCSSSFPEFGQVSQKLIFVVHFLLNPLQFILVQMAELLDKLGVFSDGFGLLDLVGLRENPLFSLLKGEIVGFHSTSTKLDRQVRGDTPSCGTRSK